MRVLDQPAFAYHWDKQHMVRCNDAFVSFLGFENVDEAMRASFASVSHPEDQEMAKSYITPTEIKRSRCRIVRKDGTYVWAEVHGIVSPNGHMINVFRDLTEELTYDE